jgi:arsenite methyltransferase
MHDPTDIKEAVRERYAGHAVNATSCCGSTAASSCGCGTGSELDLTRLDAELGYDPAELAEIPEGANLGLGCGNPLGLLELQPGETVVDLGSGGGIDCFLAAKRVGPAGRVIGVDMTPEMIARARRNAGATGFDNVEFRLGEIEHLPVADASVDAIISNCVINLVPDKQQVFADTFRVLKPGGRLSVSDIVLLGEVPVAIRDSVDAYVACLSGAVLRDEYLGMLANAGFTDVRVTEARTYDPEDVVAADIAEEYAKHSGVGTDELRRAAAMFQSVRVQARKPA